MEKKRVMKLASRGKRFGAYCIDKVLPFILVCVTLGAVAKLAYIPSMIFGYSYGYGIGSGGGAIGSVIAILFSALIGLAYLGVQIFFYSKSKTIGKAILGMQVISSVNGQALGIGKMILREWFAKKASGAVFCLGYIWILIDDKNRGWHDKIMDSYVVDLNESAKLNKYEPDTENVKPVESREDEIAEERIAPLTEEPIVDIDADQVNEVEIIDDEPESIEEVIEAGEESVEEDKEQVQSNNNTEE